MARQWSQFPEARADGQRMAAQGHEADESVLVGLCTMTAQLHVFAKSSYQVRAISRGTEGMKLFCM